MAPIIKVDNLTKKFGNVAAVDHLVLEIEEGEILGRTVQAKLQPF
jgi:ABC-type multidrug transport system ATPase subunit